jgi:glycosyltransferase involved in cell wall biosynthesis
MNESSGAQEGQAAKENRSGRCAVTVLVPARNEAGNLPVLVPEIEAALEDTDFEVIVIDDGSSDDTFRVARDLAEIRPWLRAVRFRKSCGQSAAIRFGLLAAAGRVVVTIDGDCENDPAYIPSLLETLEAAGQETGMCAGQRVGRTAGWMKRVGSRIANKVRGAILKDGTRDSGCGLKAIRTDVFLRLPYFTNWHRFLPALVVREGYKVVHLDVVDRNRRYGASNYGIWDRLWVGIMDLLGVWWLRRSCNHSPRVEDRF